MSKGRGGGVGRPEATSHAEIEAAAFELFAVHTFEGTTLDMIAEAVGVSRRTLFRYYASKNDIPWGQFDHTLKHFRDLLDQQPQSMPVHEAIGRGVVAFNAFPRDAQPQHAVRMRLILETPALTAHSALKYTQWRDIVAAFAAERLDETADSLTPVLLGHVALGIALTAYAQWLGQGHGDVETLLSILEQSVASLDRLYGHRR